MPGPTWIRHRRGPAAVSRNPGGDHSWTASIDGAVSINALAVSPEGDSVYAAGTQASGAGFLVRLSAADGSVSARLDLESPVFALAVGAEGSIYTGGKVVQKVSPQLAPIFSSDPGGDAVGLIADPADGALYTAINAGGRAFAAKLSADGSTWLYRTAIGPASAAGIAFDGPAIYLMGSTDSLDFPIKNPVQDWRNGTSDAFVTKFNAPDGAVLWSTYLGGRGADAGTAIAMSDDLNRVMVAGWTTSFDFPGASGGQWWHGGEDGFVTEIDAATATPMDSHLIGTALDERVQALSVSRRGIVAGGTAGVTTLALKASAQKPAPRALSTGTTPQTITWAPISYQTFGTPPLTLSATTGFKHPAVVFTSVTKPVCTVSGTTATLVAVGLCTIQASQPGDTQFAPAPTVTQSFSVTKGAVTSMTVLSGSTPQTTSLSAPFPTPLGVLVKDAGGNPVTPVSVTLTAPSSGASGKFSSGSAAVTASTNTSGIVSLPFTANGTAGSYTVTAAGAGLKAAFTLANAAGKMTPNAGTTPQLVNPSSMFGNALGVTITVANAPLPGVPVTFTAPSSGASGTFKNGATSITVTTGGTGIAVVAFTSNATIGSYTVTASAPGLSASFSLTNSAATTRASASSAPQYADAGEIFGFPLALVVMKPNTAGKLFPAPGVSVTFTAPASGASGFFSNFATTVTVVTDSTGTASTPFKANTNAGYYQVVATSPNLPPVTFSLANAGAAAFLQVIHSSTPQLTNINTAFPTQLGVTVLDQLGIPVMDTSVTFTAPASGASGKFSNGSQVINVASGRDGTAKTTFVANGTGGAAYAVTATVPKLNSVRFSLMNAGTPLSITAAPGATPQSMQVFTSPKIALSVTLKDGYNNPVPNIPVTFTVPASGPSLELPAGGNTSVVKTSSQGVATLSVVESNGTIGGYTVTASAANLPTVKFALSNTVGGLCYMLPNTFNPHQARLGTTYALPLTVTLYDCANNPVPNTPVTFTAPPLSGNSGTFSNGSTVLTITTNAAGVASTPVTANMLGGTGYGVIVSAPTYFNGVYEGPITQSFILQNVGPPTQIECYEGCYQSASIGTDFAPIVVLVEDAWSTGIDGIPVTFTVQLNPSDPGFCGPQEVYKSCGPASMYFLPGQTLGQTTVTTSWGSATVTATPNCNAYGIGYRMTASGGGLSLLFGAYTNLPKVSATFCTVPGPATWESPWD